MPTLQAGLVRLGTSLPFAEAARLLAAFTTVTVSEATARRLTERAGAASVAVQTAEAERLAREAPEPAAGPATQLVSVDGAMVPLVGGEWAEVKTLAIGEVVPDEAEPGAVRTTDLSYFSRLAPAEEFVRLATVEVWRRGVEAAGRVAGVADGAAWAQGLYAAHRPDAVRILDQPHALEHLSAAAQAWLGPGTAATSEWLGVQAHELTHGDPDKVLAALRALPTAATDPAAAEGRDATLGYPEARRGQIAYAAFRAAGLPIGSGAVESANKLVVAARLKGAGMHWARRHVNPMVALRTVVCSGRWDEAWPQVAREQRARARQQAQARRAARQAPPAAVAPPPPAPAPARPTTTAVPRPQPSGRPKLVVNGRPTAAHPWKRPFRATPPPTTPTTEL